jgi:DNA-directed RNA polymerase specialized sigma24 family protein
VSSGQGSVTGWIASMREGDQDALEAFSKRYFSKIRDLAKSRLSKPDSEEVANDVLVALTQSIAEGKYPDLCDRSSLWFLILKITQCRIIANSRRGHAKKRIPAESIEVKPALEPIKMESLTDYEVELDQVIASKSSEVAWIEISDCWEELLKCLPDDDCRKIAQLKLQSYTNREIAIKLEYTPSKVDRKVRIIQEEWKRIINLNE